uniref:DUF1752 domain-containing protein n=1 Tax=Heterorhabditis bacteriophora TaxID=37862 RepID=A0A1I7WZ82_HETBA
MAPMWEALQKRLKLSCSTPEGEVREGAWRNAWAQNTLKVRQKHKTHQKTYLPEFFLT